MTVKEVSPQSAVFQESGQSVPLPLREQERRFPHKETFQLGVGKHGLLINNELGLRLISSGKQVEIIRELSQPLVIAWSDDSEQVDIIGDREKKREFGREIVKLPDADTEVTVGEKYKVHLQHHKGEAVKMTIESRGEIEADTYPSTLDTPRILTSFQKINAEAHTTYAN